MDSYPRRHLPQSHERCLNGDGAMRTLGQLSIEIDGLGLIVYSPFAMAAVPEGDRFLSEHFFEPSDVATAVHAGRIAAFCTGSPGSYHIELAEGPPDLPAIAGFPWMIRLVLEVRDRTVCIRDVYDMSRWAPACPPAQTIELPDGLYRLTVGTRPTDSGIVGDDQHILVAFERVDALPPLSWEGVPFLGDEDDVVDEIAGGPPA
jgi:hypothetical protein